jgi:hypothetical protein
MVEHARATGGSQDERYGDAWTRHRRATTDRAVRIHRHKAIDEQRADVSPDVCPVIHAFVDAWREGLPETERAVLVPLAATIAGSRATPEVEARRGLMAADWLIRTCAPVWLGVAGLNKQACLLYGLPEITVMTEMAALRAMLARVSREAYAEAAGVDEEGWIKASDDCWACGWAGAFDAARLASEEPAWTSAAAAVRAAAGLAARKSSCSFIAALQVTATKLVTRMAASGAAA